MKAETQRGLVWILFSTNLLLILFFWWTRSSLLITSGQPGGILLALGRLAGLLAQYFILAQLVLISRAPFIEKVYGFDKLNQLHRKIGYTLAAAIVIHPLLITAAYAKMSNLSLWNQFINILQMPDVMDAFAAIIIIIVLGILAVPFFRVKMRYGIWHAIHLFIYLAIGLVFGHQVREGVVSYGAGFYYWYMINFSIFGAVLVYRFLQPIFLNIRHRFYIDKIVKETETVYSVYIKGRDMDKFKFEAGQYINIGFLAKKMWEPHPFSISSAPNSEYIRLSIKSSGDFTNGIRALTPGTKVLLEGPLGRFTESSSKRDKYLFIAGGIGITPIRSLLESLSKKHRDAVLLYANRSLEETALKNELDQLLEKRFYIMSQSRDPAFESGYIDKEKIIRLVPDFKDREIFLCGSEPMMESVLTLLLKDLGVPKSQVHYEIFKY